MKEMTKEEWNMERDEMMEMIDYQSQIILDLQVRLESSKNGQNRKSQVLEILRTHSSISIVDIAKKLGISAKNVSSQLTYLRTDGYKVFTDNHGKKVLMNMVIS